MGVRSNNAADIMEASHGEAFLTLSAFQRDLLGVIAYNDGEYGLKIKRDITSLYDEQINSSRVYHNLTGLSDMGLVSVEAVDNRTNEYALTEDGELAIQTLSAWLNGSVMGDMNGAEN